MDTINWRNISNDIFSAGMTFASKSGQTLGVFGIVHEHLLKMMDIDQEVYFAELEWNHLMQEAQQVQITFCEISKFPEVKRDLALLADKSITFADIKKTAMESERRFLKRMNLFDVYEGQNLKNSEKKSYAVSFYLQDIEKTLNDKQIDAIMSKIQHNLEDKLGIQLR